MTRGRVKTPAAPPPQPHNPSTGTSSQKNGSKQGRNPVSQALCVKLQTFHCVSSFNLPLPQHCNFASKGIRPVSLPTPRPDSPHPFAAFDPLSAHQNGCGCLLCQRRFPCAAQRRVWTKKKLLNLDFATRSPGRGGGVSCVCHVGSQLPGGCIRPPARQNPFAASIVLLRYRLRFSTVLSAFFVLNLRSSDVSVGRRLAFNIYFNSLGEGVRGRPSLLRVLSRPDGRGSGCPCPGDHGGTQGGLYWWSPGAPEPGWGGMRVSAPEDGERLLRNRAVCTENGREKGRNANKETHLGNKTAGYYWYS